VVDMIVPRGEQRETIARIVSILQKRPAPVAS
jgi:acetyl-CoA carboxylase beta subunit